MLRAGEDPGFFLGGGAPLRNVVIDLEVKRNLKRVHIYEETDRQTDMFYLGSYTKKVH